MEKLRLAFMGTPEFAVPALQALMASPHEIVAVYSQPPRPAGRGKKTGKSPVHVVAEQAGITVLTPESLKGPEAARAFRALKPDVAVVAAYGQILPPAILDAPPLGCINIHASLLPRWRGAAPIHRAIMEGDLTTGVTIMQMDAGLDTGAIVMSIEIPIQRGATTGELHDQLATLGARLIVSALDSLQSGLIKPTPQPLFGACYAEKIDKKEAHIDWNRTAHAIDRLVRGLFPAPGAWCKIDGERLKILAGQAEKTGGPQGVTLDDTLLVGCAAGSYRILKAQRPGKAPMDAGEMLRGHPVAKGSVLT
jgi:methionyl-tRNA formyltransferase